MFSLKRQNKLYPLVAEKLGLDQLLAGRAETKELKKMPLYLKAILLS
jgi:hypothetical protein